MNLTNKNFFTSLFDQLSSYKIVRKIWYSSNIAIFFIFIFIPTLFVLIYFLDRLDLVNSFVLSNNARLSIILRAVALSFAVSFSVTAFDLIFGLVIAWVLAKKNFPGKEFVNTLIESPLAVPTAGLGFSVALFWAKTPSINVVPFGSVQLVDNPFLLIVLFHLTTTFPYVVRSLSELLEEIDKSYEIAALTCGASRFTAARTITLPMFRSGISTAAILSMAKSLSDTGGVVTLLTTLKGSKLTQNDIIQGTALIDVWKKTSSSSTDPNLIAQYQAALAFVSLLMIISSLVILFLMKSSIKSFKSPNKKVYPNFEKQISARMYVNFRNAISFSFMILFIFVPSFFILAYLIEMPIVKTSDWNPFINSIAISFLIATIATILAAFLGLTIGIIISRKKSKYSAILDSLIDVPYLVPSAALGISVALFWNSPIAPLKLTFELINIQLSIPDIVLVIFVHTAMVFPFITRNIVGGLDEFDISIEETARTLGAKPFSVFKDLTLPAIKGSILAGAVMAFTRSVGETGATSAVSNLQTAPVFIVGQITSSTPNYGLAALNTLVLAVIGYLFIIVSKLLVNSKGVKQAITKFKILIFRKNTVTS